MRHTHPIGLRLGAILVGIALGSGSAPAADRDPFLKTSGRAVRDARGKGEVVAFRGVNLGGWLVFEPWMTPMDASGLPDDFSVRATLDRRFGPKVRDELLDAYQDAWLTEADLDAIAALGMNVVRLPFWYRNLQEEDETWRPDAFRRLDWLVAQAWRRGIYTILDFHGAPGGQSESESTGRVRKKSANGLVPEFWSNPAHLDRSAEIWRRVAEHFRGNPAVAAYDLLNEPISAPSRDALWSTYDRLYRAIRAVDPDHIITVEGCWSGEADGHHVGWGWDVLPPPTRFGWTNVVYQMHNYEWDWNNLAKLIASTDHQLADARAHASWDVPFWLGEFNPMAQEKAWSHALRSYDEAGVGWMIWSYRAIHGPGDDSWGVSNPRTPLPPKPDLQKDSAAVIREKWSRWTPAAFAPNPMLMRELGRPKLRLTPPGERP